MTNTIGQKLKEIIDPITTLYLSEAQTDNLPFCVYDAEYREERTKEGIYKVVGYITLFVVAMTFEQAESLMTAIKTAINGIESPQYNSTFIMEDKKSYEGVWILKAEYNINQYKI